MRYLDLTLRQMSELCRNIRCADCQVRRSLLSCPFLGGQAVACKPSEWRNDPYLNQDCTHLGYPLLQAGPRYIDLTMDLFSECCELEDITLWDGAPVKWANKGPGPYLQIYPSTFATLESYPGREFRFLHPEIYGPTELRLEDW